MTDLSKAGQGIRFLYRSEIIELLGTIINAIAVGFSEIAILASAHSLVFTGGVFKVVSVILIIVSTLFSILAFLLEHVGIKQAAKQNKSIKHAYHIVLLGIAISIFKMIAALIWGSQTTVTSVLSAALIVFDLIVTILITKGCCALLDIKGQQKLASWGRKQYKFFIILWVLAVIFYIVISLTKGVISSIFVAFVIICVVISYLKYLLFLKKTYLKLDA